MDTLRINGSSSIAHTYDLHTLSQTSSLLVADKDYLLEKLVLIGALFYSKVSKKGMQSGRETQYTHM